MRTEILQFIQDFFAFFRFTVGKMGLQPNAILHILINTNGKNVRTAPQVTFYKKKNENFFLNFLNLQIFVSFKFCLSENEVLKFRN